VPVKRIILLSLIVSTVIWLIVLIPAALNTPELSFTTDDSPLLQMFQWLRVIGLILLPFTIFLSVIAMWLLFFLRLLRGAVMAAILPLFSLLIYSIGASGMRVMGAG
jgi:hypothetical protein